MIDSPGSFQDVFAATFRSAGLPDRSLTRGECQSSVGRRCSLCVASRLTYEQELVLKETALREYWSRTVPGTPLEPFVPSPRGRAYRAVSKRKVFHERTPVEIGLIDPSEHISGRFDPLRCAIEPNEHAVIYDVVRKELARTDNDDLATRLKYVIIKGTDSHLSIIFNVGEIAPGVIKAANRISKRLSSVSGTIAGSFLFEGNDDDRYYQAMSAHRPRRTIRKLFGKTDIAVSVGGKKLFFSPFCFTQINHSMLGHLVTSASSLLKLTKEMTLYDLYCGYGLFALLLADQARSVVGAEQSVDAIDAARSNAENLGLHNVRFIRTDITASSIGSIMQNARPVDAVLLDPPRAGTAKEIPESVAALNPARVVHVFCSIDLVASDIKRWNAAGYDARRAVPLDMFPGTPNVELMVLLERQ